jgi:hypothetical protein
MLNQGPHGANCWESKGKKSRAIIPLKHEAATGIRFFSVYPFDNN